MEIFKHLPLIGEKRASSQDEYDAAEAKKARIKYHRDNVRNGPVKMRSMTNGQYRRAQERAAARAQAKNYRKQVRNHFAERREAAILHAMLVGVGLIPTEARISGERARDAVIWLTSRFAEAPGGIEQVEVTEKLVRDALTSAVDRFNSLTNDSLRVPEAWSPPVKFAV